MSCRSDVRYRWHGLHFYVRNRILLLHRNNHLIAVQSWSLLSERLNLGRRSRQHLHLSGWIFVSRKDPCRPHSKRRHVQVPERILLLARSNSCDRVIGWHLQRCARWNISSSVQTEPSRVLHQRGIDHNWDSLHGRVLLPCRNHRRSRRTVSGWKDASNGWRSHTF